MNLSRSTDGCHTLDLHAADMEADGTPVAVASVLSSFADFRPWALPGAADDDRVLGGGVSVLLRSECGERRGAPCLLS